MRILLVEDQPKLARLLQQGLREERHDRGRRPRPGADGVWMATEQPYDVVVLDVMLPDVDGLEVCRRIRAVDDRTPILMLTALDAVPDRVAGLGAGADDYLVKPFAFDELLARLRALARRGGVRRSDELAVGDLRLDLTGHLVHRGTTEVDPDRAGVRAAGGDGPSSGRGPQSRAPAASGLGHGLRAAVQRRRRMREGVA